MANFLLYFVHQPGSLLDAQARPSTHVQPELAGINGREKVCAKKENQSSGSHAKRQESRHECCAMMRHRLHQVAIRLPQPLEAALESFLQASQKAGLWLFCISLMVAIQIH